MGFHRGANIIRDGLVFGYDIGYPMISSSFDFYKFNLGEPTTNLADTDTKRTIVGHSVGAYQHSVSASEAPSKGPGWKQVKIISQGTNPRICQFPYISVGTTAHSYSIEYDFESLNHSTGSGTSGYYWKIDGNTGTPGTNVKDTGAKKSMTFTRSSTGTQAIFLMNNSTNRADVNEVIYYKNYQVEEKSHNSPFVETTRSISGSLLNITGSHDVKLSSTSFSNEGQLTFDGTNDYVEIPSFFVPTGSRTVEVVVKAATADNGSHQKHIFANSDQPGNGTGDAGLAILYRDGHFRGYVWEWDGANSPRTNLVFETNIPADKYYHLVLTHDDVMAKGYTNGVLTTSGSCEGSRYPSNDTTIGRYSPSYNQGFNGDIPLVRVYDRALSVEEIQQNFNSIRNRFDI